MCVCVCVCVCVQMNGLMYASKHTPSPVLPRLTEGAR